MRQSFEESLLSTPLPDKPEFCEFRTQQYHIGSASRRRYIGQLVNIYELHQASLKPGNLIWKNSKLDQLIARQFLHDYPRTAIFMSALLTKNKS
jgi:hypothetical protein